MSHLPRYSHLLENLSSGGKKSVLQEEKKNEREFLSEGKRKSLYLTLFIPKTPTPPRRGEPLALKLRVKGKGESRENGIQDWLIASVGISLEEEGGNDFEIREKKEPG